MGKVFISYSHDDSAVADQIAEILERLRVEYFRDVKDINWGQQISGKVHGGLSECVAIIAIISPASAKSQWVAYEVGFGTAKNKTILPYLTHPKQDVPSFFGDIVYVASISDLEKHFQKSDWIQSTSQPSEVRTVQTPLDDLQQQYLKEISRPHNNGFVSGSVNSVKGRDLVPYQEAVESFVARRLMTSTSGGYKLTSQGWKCTDQLWMLAILDALETKRFLSDLEIAKQIGLTEEGEDIEELQRLLTELEKSGYVNLAKSRGGRSAILLPSGLTQRKHREIDLT